MSDDDKPIRVILAHEPSPPMSKTEKAFGILAFLILVWTALPPRKRRG